MRTGLTPNAHASVAEAGTDLSAELPSPRLRAHLRRQAELLDRIHEAAGRGDTAAVLHEASILARHRDQAHHAAPSRLTDAEVLDFDTTAA